MVLNLKIGSYTWEGEQSCTIGMEQVRTCICACTRQWTPNQHAHADPSRDSKVVMCAQTETEEHILKMHPCTVRASGQLLRSLQAMGDKVMGSMDFLSSLSSLGPGCAAKSMACRSVGKQGSLGV